MLFIKFGKKEHLEQLRNGIVHFSTLKTFQKDPTSFRGDKMEGRLYIDPKQPMLVNGLDISSFMKECVISYETNCPEFSFSASILRIPTAFRMSGEWYCLISIITTRQIIMALMLKHAI